MKSILDFSRLHHLLCLRLGIHGQLGIQPPDIENVSVRAMCVILLSKLIVVCEYVLSHKGLAKTGLCFQS